MKKTSTMTFWVGALFALGLAWQSVAQEPEPGPLGPVNVPGTMNYQGRLVGPTGTPYADGVYTLEIRLYTTPDDGIALWGGTYASVVKDGYFNVILGSTIDTPLVDPLYANTSLWKALWPDQINNGVPGEPFYLSVTPWQDATGSLIDPNSRVELSPRQALSSAPYAFRAQTAEYANQSAGDFTVGRHFTFTNAVEVQGSGQMKWSVPGLAMPPSAPMGLEVVTNTFPGGTYDVYIPTRFESDQYTVVIVGLESSQNYITSFYAYQNFDVPSKWEIAVKRDWIDGPNIVKIKLLWINKNWTDVYP